MEFKCDKEERQPFATQSSQSKQSVNTDESFSGEHTEMQSVPSIPMEHNTDMMPTHSRMIQNQPCERSQNAALESTRCLIQELSHHSNTSQTRMYATSSFSHDQPQSWYPDDFGTSSSDDDDDSDGSDDDSNLSESLLVGSLNGCMETKLATNQVDQDEDFLTRCEIRNAWSQMNQKNRQSQPLQHISTQKLALHHLYLTAMSLAWKRQCDERNDPNGRAVVTSSDLELTMNDKVGLEIGRTYPADVSQTWASWKKQDSTSNSPLLAEVLICSQPSLALKNAVSCVCLVPELDLVTIVFGVGGDFALHDDACWEDVISPDRTSHLVKDLLNKLPKKFANVSFVGVGGGAALATLCGLCASGDTNYTVFVFSFGAPHLGDSNLVQQYQRFEQYSNKLRIVRFVNRYDTEMLWRPCHLLSRYHGACVKVDFSSRVRGIQGYWQHLEKWDASMPLEDLLKCELARKRWSKKWLLFAFLVSVYLPLIILTLSVRLKQPQVVFQTTPSSKNDKRNGKKKVALRKTMEMEPPNSREEKEEETTFIVTERHAASIHVVVGDIQRVDIVVKHRLSPIVSPDGKGEGGLPQVDRHPLYSILDTSTGKEVMSGSSDSATEITSQEIEDADDLYDKYVSDMPIGLELEESDNAKSDLPYRNLILGEDLIERAVVKLETDVCLGSPVVDGFQLLSAPGITASPKDNDSEGNDLYRETGRSLRGGAMIIDQLYQGILVGNNLQFAMQGLDLADDVCNVACESDLSLGEKIRSLSLPIRTPKLSVEPYQSWDDDRSLLVFDELVQISDDLVSALPDFDLIVAEESKATTVGTREIGLYDKSNEIAVVDDLEKPVVAIQEAFLGDMLVRDRSSQEFLVGNNGGSAELTLDGLEVFDNPDDAVFDSKNTRGEEIRLVPLPIELPDLSEQARQRLLVDDDGICWQVIDEMFQNTDELASALSCLDFNLEGEPKTTTVPLGETVLYDKVNEIILVDDNENPAAAIGDTIQREILEEDWSSQEFLIDNNGGSGGLSLEGLQVIDKTDDFVVSVQSRQQQLVNDVRMCWQLVDKLFRNSDDVVSALTESDLIAVEEVKATTVGTRETILNDISSEIALVDDHEKPVSAIREAFLGDMLVRDRLSQSYLVGNNGGSADLSLFDNPDDVVFDSESTRGEEIRSMPLTIELPDRQRLLVDDDGMCWEVTDEIIRNSDELVSALPYLEVTVEDEAKTTTVTTEEALMYHKSNEILQVGGKEKCSALACEGWEVSDELHWVSFDSQIFLREDLTAVDSSVDEKNHYLELCHPRYDDDLPLVSSIDSLMHASDELVGDHRVHDLILKEGLEALPADPPETTCEESFQGVISDGLEQWSSVSDKPSGCSDGMRDDTPERCPLHRDDSNSTAEAIAGTCYCQEGLFENCEMTSFPFEMLESDVGSERDTVVSDRFHGDVLLMKITETDPFGVSSQGFSVHGEGVLWGIDRAWSGYHKEHKVDGIFTNARSKGLSEEAHNFGRLLGVHFGKARSDIMESPLAELVYSEAQTRSTSHAVKLVFETWERTLWWKNQDANRLETKKIADAIVRDGLLRSQISIDP